MNRSVTIASWLTVLILVTSVVTPGYAAECDKKSDSQLGWAPVLEASDRLSRLICQRLDGTADESRITIENLTRDWREQVLNSASQLDGILQLTVTSSTAGSGSAQTLSQLATVFVADVEQTLAPILYTDDSPMRQKIVGGGIGVPKISSKPRNANRVLSVNTITETGGNQIGMRIALSENLNRRCKSTFGKSCITVVDNWSTAASAYKGSLVRLTAENVSELAVVYSQHWDSFYTKARAQTFLDTIYTGARYKDELTASGFVKAPKKQYFLFHPGVVLEYVEDAADGEQFREALSLEWYGFNYWEGCPVLFDSACGLSLVSTLSDRASADDHSFGLMIHYDNNLSLGVVRGMGSDEDVGYFITIDLLKAIENKQELATNWKQQVKDRYKIPSE